MFRQLIEMGVVDVKTEPLDARFERSYTENYPYRPRAFILPSCVPVFGRSAMATEVPWRVQAGLGAGRSHGWLEPVAESHTTPVVTLADCIAVDAVYKST